MCEASDSLATTYHLYIVEAVRTEGSSPPKNGRQRQKEWNGGIKKRELDRLTLAKLSWVELGWVTWTGLDMFWDELELVFVGRSNFSVRIQSPIHTCTWKANKEKLGLEWHIMWMLWLKGQMVGCHSCLLWGTVTCKLHKYKDCTDWQHWKHQSYTSLKYMITHMWCSYVYTQSWCLKARACVVEHLFCLYSKPTRCWQRPVVISPPAYIASGLGWFA